MAKTLTEDQVRNAAEKTLGLDATESGVKQGTGQLTKFTTLGVASSLNAPDGWYIPDNKNDVSILYEAKNSRVDITLPKWIKEINDNCQILMDAGWNKVIGIIDNGQQTLGFFNNKPIDIPNTLQHKTYYINLINNAKIDKQLIYKITARINNILHTEFGVKNLYHRMIFTACALVAERYGANLSKIKGLPYNIFQSAIYSQLAKSLEEDKKQNTKIDCLLDVYKAIRMNITQNQLAIDKFIDCICDISSCINSNAWCGEDVMGIFFNEFTRYKKKSDSGQVFTPDHITSFMYKLLGVTKDDYVGDFACGSGSFLVKAMSNMMKEAGGYDTNEAKEIRQNHLFGIDFDKEIFALACANMMIHKDGKTNLELLDTRYDEACKWIMSKKITKVLMNPPFETKYGCIKIVENVLNNVNPGTECAFILPDKKLDKAKKTIRDRILSNHTIEKIIKLPKPLFVGVGVQTSIFVFIAGKPQNNKLIYGCYIEDDGLETLNNKGRHDIKGKWDEIEDYWIKSIYMKNDTKYGTSQIIDPTIRLSYEIPKQPLVLTEDNFKKSALDFICYSNGIDSRDFAKKMLDKIMTKGTVSNDSTNVIFTIKNN